MIMSTSKPSEKSLTLGQTRTPERVAHSSGFSEACSGAWFTASGGGIAVEVPDGQLPAWFQETVEKLFDMLNLGTNWSSYNSKAPQPDTVKCSFGFLYELLSQMPTLPQPAIVPTPSGRIQFEWHERGVDLEICVYGVGHIEAYAELLDGSWSFDGDISSQLKPIEKALQHLTAD